MNGQELLMGMSCVHSKFIQEAEFGITDTGERGVRFWRKPIVLAAIIGIMLLLMGSAVVIRLTLAESDLFDYPLVDTTRVPVEDIHLTVDYVTPTAMRVYCRIEGVEYGINSVYILSSGPYTIERKTETGWEPLPAKQTDPQWRPIEILTSGSTDWYVDWSGLYGVLEPGTYRYVARVLEGNAPVSVEFTVEEPEQADLQEAVQTVLEGAAYRVRCTERVEFGPMDHLPEEERKALEMDAATYTYDYIKSGADLLYLCHRGDKLWIGMMYKDGIKYGLDFEDDNRSNPVIGWSCEPGMDMSRLTEWAAPLIRNLDVCEVAYREDGSVSHFTRTVSGVNSYEVSYTGEMVWEILSTDEADAAAVLAEQDVNVAREFSWKQEQKIRKALDVPFVNTGTQPVTKASEAVARALAECTVEHDKILCYRDEEAGMWKVEFQIMFGYQGYQFIYLNDNGITVMVSGAGSKEPAWQALYPDP